MNYPKGWPSSAGNTTAKPTSKGSTDAFNLNYVTDLVWDPAVSTEHKATVAPTTKPRVKNDAKPNPSLVIKAITQPGHPAHGQRGLFAAKAIRESEHLVDYLGYVTTAESASENSDYVLGFGPQSVLAIDADRGFGNEARFVNDYRGVPVVPGRHQRTKSASGKPNQYQPKNRPNVCFRDRIDTRGHTYIGIYAIDDIQKGSELLISYGKGFWKAREGDGQSDQSSKCHTHY
eukprot:Clim_evm18s169 gene=Clim_evmTU18s169